MKYICKWCENKVIASFDGVEPNDEAKKQCAAHRDTVHKGHEADWNDIAWDLTATDEENEIIRQRFIRWKEIVRASGGVMWYKCISCGSILAGGDETEKHGSETGHQAYELECPAGDRAFDETFNFKKEEKEKPGH